MKYRRCASGRRERRQSGEKETEDLAREEKTVADSGAREREGQRDGRRFALRRDRKRDSLGLVIYLKRSRAPCATTRGTEASAHRVLDETEREKESRWRRRR